MATLRELIGVNTDSGRAARLQDEDIANGMGSIAKGWTSGRIAADANALRAEELNLRAAGDTAGSDTLRGQIDQLQQRQQLYAPEVGRVEDIGSVGQAASWLGGQVGQGAASMVDPIAAGTAIGGATKLAGLLPGGLGRGAKLLGGLATAAVPVAMNQRQMTGEFGNEAARDPELMARASPTELRNAANIHGLVAGGLDTVMPYMVGKQLLGTGLRQGVSAFGPGAKMLGGMALEGGTELAQGKASQYTQGYLNPNRDTSGDASDDLNNFAGGAAGGAPFAGAGAFADAGYRRVGDTAERLGEGFHDLAAPAVEAGRGLFGRAKEGVTDLAGQAQGAGTKMFGRAKAEVMDLASGDDGEVSAASLLGNLKDAAQNAGNMLKGQSDERDTLEGNMPEAISLDKTEAGMAKGREWLAQNDQKRAQLVSDKLAAMEENDPEAGALLDKIMGTQDPELQQAAYDEGADFVLARMPTGRAEQRASKLGQTAGAVGSVLGKAGMAAGRTALDVGKAMLSGVKEGMAKKNMQTDEAPGEESFSAWRDNYYGVNGQKVVAHELAKGRAHVMQVEADQRAELAGSYADDMAKRAWPKDRSMGALMRRTAYAIADMSEAWDTGAASTESRSGTIVGREAKLNRIADDLRQGFKLEAPGVLQSIGSILGTSSSEVINYMKDELAQQMAPRGVERTKQLRAQLANDMVGLIGIDERSALMKQGVNLHEPAQAAHVLGLMEDYADGIGTEKGNGQRRGLDALLGKDGVDKILGLLNGLPEKDKVGSVVDDRGENGQEILEPGDDESIDGQTTAYEQAAQEKNVRNSAEKPVYGFAAEKHGRVGDTRHPFYTTEKLSKKDTAERLAAGDDTEKRPSLFRTGQTLFSHKDSATKANVYEPAELVTEDEFGRKKKTSNLAIDKRVRDLGDEMGVERDEGGNPTNHVIETKTAHDVMKSLNLQPGAILALHRDYLKKDATLKSEQYPLTPAERTALEVQSAQVGRLLQKMVKTAKGEGADGVRKMTINERVARKQMLERMVDEGVDETMSVEDYAVQEALTAAKAYFSERHMVVAKQMTNAVPEKISYTELREMANMGGRSLDFARKQADGDERVEDELTSQANIIMFEPLPGKDGKPPPAIAIPAGKLVKWAMQQRGKFESEGKKKENLSDKEKNSAYRRDVMAAVSAIMDSGLVGKAWPHKMNEGGEQESFADGIPPSLQLAVSNQGREDNATANWQGKRASRHGQADLHKFQGPNQERVAREQTKGDDAQDLTEGSLDDVIDDTPMKRRIIHNALTREEKVHLNSLDSVAARNGFIASIASRLDKDEQAAFFNDLELTNVNGAAFNPDAKSSKTGDRGATEMDFFKERKADEVPGDFDDQQFLTQQTMAGFELPKSKMAAMRGAKYSAEKITTQLMADPRMARDTIMSHIRVALQGGGHNANGTVGDAYHIAPIIDLVSPENVARFVKRGAPPNLVDGMKRAALTVLIRAAEGRNEISDSHLTALARQLGVPEDLKGMQALLVERGPLNLKQLEQYVSPKNPSAPMVDVGAKPLGRNVRDAGRQDEMFNESVDMRPGFKRTPNKIDGAPGEASRSVSQAFVDKQTLKANAKPGSYTEEQTSRDTSQSEMFAPTKTTLRQRQEVAAGLGKPSGASKALNAQEGSPAGFPTDAVMAQARAYAAKTLGPKIKVMFQDITGYSGEFIDATNTIVISTTAAAGTMGTLYHEAMHVFFRDFVKSNPKLQTVFEGLINDPKHLAKLKTLLTGFPAAQAQLTSGEERLSYTYQFWKAGLLQVDTQAHTWLQKVGKFFRQVMGRVRDSEHALALFQAFDQGKMSEPSAAGQVIARELGQGSLSLKVRRQLDGLVQGVAALGMPAGEILRSSASPTAKALGKLLFTNPGEAGDGNEATGMMNARRNIAQVYTNAANQLFAEMSDVDQRAVQKHLQVETALDKITDPDHREIVAKVRGMLDKFHAYMLDAGMKIGKIDNYYPTVWSSDALLNQKKEFVEMLATKYARDIAPGGADPYKAATRIWQSLVSKEGVDAHLPAGREDGVLNPFFASQEMRTLPFLKGVDKERFLEKNMPLTMTRYFAQGAHATEYFRRFGKDGHKLSKMLDTISDELRTASQEMVRRGALENEDARVKWHGRQMRDISQSVGAMEGSLGKDVSPSMRKFNSWMAVYQNIRLLPMSLFSSFVDPLALVARGAPMQAAYETFVYGIREVFRTWADAFKDMPPQRAKDEWRELSEHIGASEIAMFSHHVADEYSSTYMTAGAKKLNDKMFVLNGMEAWNRGSRIMATKWAVRFLEKHSALPDKNHSARWLKELGLTASMLTIDDGKLVTNRDQLAALKGISVERADQLLVPVYEALNRWVEGAVLTPNAAQRPAWSSDPNYATMFHLKQFSYSFHQTILKRAVNEFKNGNMAPVGALAMFIPTMITADIMKGLIQGGGSLPPYMASMNAGDWFMHGVNRAGLAGIGVIGVDAGSDMASLGGPAIEQAVDALRDPAGKSLLNAMPLHALYGQAFK